ncbi:MAG: polysaccharide deacetylase family protein [Crocinitomicaceae bacterium]|nr:polysaccharide deacetylase family protein [Crocinitomicaceae bacterium]
MFRSPTVLRRIFPLRIWGISVSDQSLFLTFDDGPNPEITPWVLEFLEREGIKATFFCVGENVQKHPEIYQQILSFGHRVGNHTMKHLNGMKTPKNDYLASISETEQYIQSNLFRPPYGRLRKTMDATLRQRFQIVMWSWLSKDYDNTIEISKIIKASNRIKAGDILVFHDNVKTKDRLKELLPPIIKNLKEKGFAFRLIE